MKYIWIGVVIETSLLSYRNCGFKAYRLVSVDGTKILDCDTDKIDKLLKRGLIINPSNGKTEFKTGYHYSADTTKALSLQLNGDKGHGLFTMLEAIVDEKGKRIGYKIESDSAGVLVVRAQDLIERVSNGDYIVMLTTLVRAKSGAYFRGYHDKIKTVPEFDGFKVLNSIDMYKNSGCFNKEQVWEITRGLESGLDVRVYARPEYPAIQMRFIRILLMKNLNPSLILGREFDACQLAEITYAIMHNVNARLIANRNFSAIHMFFLRVGLEFGIDISSYAIEGLSFEVIRDRYFSLIREKGLME